MADFPTNGDDVIFGNERSTVIDALGGNDVVFGLGGNDDLIGGTGDDKLSGGPGLDDLFGGAGSDTAYYALAIVPVFASLKLGFGYLEDSTVGKDADEFFSIENIEGGAAGDTLIGDAQDNRLDGNGGDDELYGDDGADTLTGEAGNDTLGGGGGSDTLLGGSGSDTLSGWSGGDIIDGGGGIDLLDFSEVSDKSGVTVNLTSGLGFNGDAARDRYSNIENIHGSVFDDTLIGHEIGQHIDGSSGDDRIEGKGGSDFLQDNFGQDTILGGGGDDLILGGRESDTLRGGGGKDTFLYKSLLDSLTQPDSRDEILDFQQGLDRIKFDFDADTSDPDKDSAIFIGTDAFSNGVSGEVRYAIQDGRTIISFSFGPDGGADLRIVLEGEFNLTESDFGL